MITRITRRVCADALEPILDLEEPDRFVEDIRKVMHPDALWIVQMSYLPVTLKTNELGIVYHEHPEYNSMQCLEYLLRQHDMESVDVEINEINGGSIRTGIRNRSDDSGAFADRTYSKLAGDRMNAFRDDESHLGLGDSRVNREFSTGVHRSEEDVAGLIRTEVAAGKKLYVNGASTREKVFLQCFELAHSPIATRRSAIPTRVASRPSAYTSHRPGGGRPDGEAGLLPRRPLAFPQGVRRARARVPHLGRPLRRADATLRSGLSGAA